MSVYRDFSDLHADFGILSVVTYAMVIDQLSEYRILHEPNDRRRLFKWVSSYHALELSTGHAPEETLFVCGNIAGKNLVEDHPECFALVAVENDTPDWVQDRPDNVLVIRCTRNDSLLQKLQLFFQRRQIASHNFEIAFAGGTPLDDVLLDAHEYVNAPLLIARRSNAGKPLRAGSVHAFMARQLIGCANGAPGQTLELAPAEHENRLYYMLIRPIGIPGSDMDKLAAAYRDKPPTAGERDSFDALARRLDMLLRKGEADYEFDASDTGTVLKRLVSGSHVSRLWLEAFKQETGIGDSSHLRLLGTDLAGLDTRERARLEFLIAKTFRNYVCGTRVGNRFVFLIHASHIEKDISNDSIQHIIEDTICPEFNVSFAASQAFGALRDAPFAHREIELVMGFSRFVDIGNEFLATDPIRGLYTFEDCFPYILINSETLDPAFKDFCLSHTAVEMLYAEDQLNGTDNARILIMYLFYGRKASVVAEKLHMHRNTVLYHLNKIQERLNFDLEDPVIQERIMLDSKTLFKRMAYTR